MAFVLSPTRLFLRKYNKLIKRDTVLEQRIDGLLQRLLVDPKDPTLASHKVIAYVDSRPAMSSTVTGDLRIIWRYGDKTEEMQILDLVDIGGHSGSKKVY